MVISEALLTHSCLITLQVVLRELESDLLPGQLLVDSGEGVRPVLEVEESARDCLLELVRAHRCSLSRSSRPVKKL